MKKFYSLAIALVAMLGVSVSANAQSGLKAPVSEALVDGAEYTLFNYCTPASYLGRTSWDGALVNWGTGADNYTRFTAQKNSDNGTWSFYITNSDGSLSYMNQPNGNVNISSDSPFQWSVEPGNIEGYYFIKPVDEANANAIGYSVHMNGSCAYIVCSYAGDSWYPDFYGGKKVDEEGNEVYDENDNIVMADSSSCNWIFVKTDNVTEYITTAGGYVAIRDFYNTYVADPEGTYESYAEGFKATYNACLDLYNGEEFFEDDVESVKAMIAAKVALYEEIAKAVNIEDGADDNVLQAAISNAIDAFNDKTAATDVETATATLQQAEVDHEMGSGDITSLGKNMSFEDLSSQDGNTTTGIAGAPTGWTVYVNDVVVSTAAEVKAAGIANWHGINADSNGEGKEGNYAFGIWTSSIPDYEISQKIEGLDNGTYIITAGLMAGSNGSGSRLTTQRIFGNISSTYYATKDDYIESELDQTECYAFQGNELINTDTELRPMEVKAYVYDGTLTFGLRTDGNIAASGRTSGNSAGGDGWFKVDNFRIQKVGFVLDDALEIHNFFYTKVDELMSDQNTMLYPSLRSEINSILETGSQIGTESSVDDINSSILALSGIGDKAFESNEMYSKLADAIEQAYENLEIYQNKQGAGLYDDAIMEVEDGWTQETYDSKEEIEAAIQKLDDALQECIQSDEIEEGSDLTEFIKNPSFEDLSNQNNTSTGGIANVPAGWSLELNGEQVSTASEISKAGVANWCAINEGDNINVTFDDVTYTRQPTDESHLWGIWTPTVPEVELSQTISNLPEGIYVLTCDMMVQHNWAGNNITTQRIFANQSVQMWGRESDYTNANYTEDMWDAQTLQTLSESTDVTYFSYAGYDNDVTEDYTSLLRPMSVTFVVGEDGTATIGMRTNSINAEGTSAPVSGAGWFKVDNFTLTCLSLGHVDVPEIPTAIKTVEPSKSVSADIYDLTGRKVSNPAKGIYIMGGKKVMVK